jgi:hypothetical protein
MSLESHALTEFRAAGFMDDNGKFSDDMQELICKQILELLHLFASHGHSGSTAPYAINLFNKLAKFEPLVPLTGEDWEWNEVSERMGSKCWQNKRASHVFKDENGAYDIEGKVFWEWCKRPYDEDEAGYPGESIYKSYYTCRESRVPVTFPYTVPDKPIYEWRWSDAEPQTPPQTEAGFL